MTTIKEYKAMMEGATDALVKAYIEGFQQSGEGWNGEYANDEKKRDETVLYSAKKYAELNNPAIELMRVIELAEEALYGAEYILGGKVTTIQKTKAYTKIREALSEIRKLKG